MCLLAGRQAAKLFDEMRRGTILYLEFEGQGSGAVAAEVKLAGFNEMHVEALDGLAD